MAQDYIQLPADSTGKRLASDTWTGAGGNTVHGQNVVLYAADGTPLLTDGRIPVESKWATTPTITDTLTSAGDTVVLDVSGHDVLSAHFDITGTFTGSSVLTFEYSFDNQTTWRPLLINYDASANPGTGNTTLTASIYSLGVNNLEAEIGGATHVRVRCSTYQASDSINIRINTGHESSIIKPVQNLQVIGSIAAGNPPSGPPVYVGASDGGNIRALNVSQKGVAPSGTPNAALVHQYKDVGRNNRTFFRRPTITTNAEVMAQLTQYYSGAAVAATATPAVVPAGKILHIQNITLSYMGVATAGGAVITLRANTSGTAVIGSPLVTEYFIGAAAGAGNTVVEDIVFPDGLEFAAGTGIAVGVQGFTAAMAANATGYVGIHINSFEY